MPVSTEIAIKRGRVAGLKRAVKTGERRPDDPVIPAAERDLAVEVLAERAQRLVATWPDLTDAQVDRIASILRGGGDA
jgi:hypothetical protein